MSSSSDVPVVVNWIDGQRVVVEPSDEHYPVTNPATGDEIARVALGHGSALVERAVSSASAAYAGWRETALRARTRILFEYLQLLRRRREELVDAIVTEHGKVADDAAGEISRGLEVVEFACGVPHLLKGDYSEDVSRGVDSHSVRQPLGVMAGITPFNFPVMVPMWTYPIAIACGNSYVLKPSEKAPSAALMLAETFAEAGLPDGVLNVVNGGADAADALLAHPDVEGVSFVGSTPVARHVYERGTAHGKRIQALGGAKNHMLVAPDADLDLAAEALVSAAYGSAGERCMAISVGVVVESVADELARKLTEGVARLRVGPGTDPASDMGPLVTAEHRDRVVDYVETGIKQGAKLLVDGRTQLPAVNASGYWLGPCLFDHVTSDMTIYREEIFGPVLCLVRVGSVDEGLELINANRWGNGATVFTRSGGLARRFSRNVGAGMVGVNVPVPVPMAYYSFGGWKQSFFGDLQVHGLAGVMFSTRGKTVTSRWPEGTTGDVDTAFRTSA